MVYCVNCQYICNKPLFRKFCDNKIVPPTVICEDYNALVICLNETLSQLQLLLPRVFSFEFRPKMEPPIGIEPTTASLQNWCSTTELQGQIEKVTIAQCSGCTSMQTAFRFYLTLRP